MWVSVDLCVVPIGVGVSLSPYITACKRVIAATGLTHQLGPNGAQRSKARGTRSFAEKVASVEQLLGPENL